MSITRTLPNFPLLNQLNEPADGTPDQNARNNCVAASIADVLNWYIGYGKWWGDELTDDVYGGSYIGPENAAKYETFCAVRGVKLASFSASQSNLIAQLHSLIADGIPALVTMPSQWGTPYPDPVHPSGSTHVGVCCGDGDGMLRIMNPWGGFWQDESDAWWQARLCYGQIWPMTKVSNAVSGVPSGWKDDGTHLLAPNGNSAVQGFRSLVEQTPGWFAALQPIGPAYGLSSPNTRQDFALSTGWDGSKLFLTSAPALVHKDQLDAAQTRVSELTSQVTQLQAQNSALQAQVAKLEAELAAPQPLPAQPGASDEETMALALFRNAAILYAVLLKTDPAVAAAVAQVSASGAS